MAELGDSRRRRLRFGIFLIAVGLLWLSINIGWTPPIFFWPLMMVTLGLWFIGAALIRGKESNRRM
jgi:hypothetical protein